MRENTERPVTITHGTNHLAKPNQVLESVEACLASLMPQTRVPALWDGRAAQRIIDILERMIKNRRHASCARRVRDQRSLHRIRAVRLSAAARVVAGPSLRGPDPLRRRRGERSPLLSPCGTANAGSARSSSRCWRSITRVISSASWSFPQYDGHHGRTCAFVRQWR